MPYLVTLLLSLRSRVMMVAARSTNGAWRLRSGRQLRRRPQVNRGICLAGELVKASRLNILPAIAFRCFFFPGG